MSHRPNNYLIIPSFFVITLLASMLIPLPAFADDPASDTTADTSSFADEFGNTECGTCFRAKPRPQCCVSIIFESFYRTRVSSSQERVGKSKFLLGADFGLMYNFSETDGLGISYYLSGDDDGSRYGIRPRYRRWLKNDVQLDLSAGILIAGDDNYGNPKWPGFIATASLSFADYISMDLQYEWYRYDVYSYSWPPEFPSETKSVSNVYFGVTGRSYLAFAMPVVLIIALIADPIDMNIDLSTN